MRRLALLFALATAPAIGCAHAGDKTPDMVAYENDRDSEAADAVRERQPELLARAQEHYESALLAHQDKERDLATHHTRMAMTIWRTAVARSEATDAERVTKRMERRRAEAEADLEKTQGRVAVARDAVDRLERIAALEAKEGSFKVREQIANAMLAVKEAEVMNAREYAPDDMTKADEALEAATAALEGNDAAGASDYAKAATKAAQRAKKTAGPEYARNKTRLAHEAQQRALFKAASGVEGGSTQMIEGGVALTLHKVFGSGDVIVDSARHGTLDEVAKLAQTYSAFTLVVDGHTDNRGGKSKNISLSQARAEAVVAHLSKKGVDPSRMTSTGKGDAAPIASNRSKTGRAENRRIEIIFVQPAG